MKNSELELFSEAMSVLASALGQEMSPLRIKGFWIALERYDWTHVESALSEAMQRKWYPFPQPADIIDLIDGSPDDRAELTWGHLWWMFDNSVSTYDSLFCEDALVAECIRVVFGGWLQAGMCPRPDSDDAIAYQAYHKTWVQTYKALSHQRRPYDAYLKGIRETQMSVRASGGVIAIAQTAVMLTRDGDAYDLDPSELKKLLEETPARKALTDGQ